MAKSTKSSKSAQSTDELKGSKRPNRRAVIKGALAVGAVSMFAGKAVAKPVQTTFVGEGAWARALARLIADQLPNALVQLPDIQLTDTQVAELRETYKNTLITNMGCVFPPD